MLFERTRPERFAFGIGQFAGNDALDPGAGAVLRKRRLWGNRATSPLYWVIVGAAAAVVAGVVLFVGSDREELPGYGVAVGLSSSAGRRLDRFRRCGSCTGCRLGR